MFTERESCSRSNIAFAFAAIFFGLLIALGCNVWVQPRFDATEHKVDKVSRVALVTGANRGIGYEVVKQLCEVRKGWKIYLTARGAMKGAEAVSKLTEQGFQVQFHQIDVDSDESVQRAADYFKTTYGGVDIIVSNAGISGEGITPLHKEVEMNINTNYYGTLRLIRSFIPIMRPNSTMILVTSGAAYYFYDSCSSETRQQFKHLKTVHELNNLLDLYQRDVTEKRLDSSNWPVGTVDPTSNMPTHGYGIAKLAVILLGRIVQSRLNEESNRNISVGIVSPGKLSTDMTHYALDTDPVDLGAKHIVDMAVSLDIKHRGKVLQFGEDVGYPWD